MASLLLQAYVQLIRFDLYLQRGNFARIRDRVREHPLQLRVTTADVVRRLCSAVDLACIWYCKEVRCLQRSAATACLLKSYGVPGQLVIGVQQLPFKAHAWVEVDGAVVNDKPYMAEMYAVLDRC
jgi:hypothetical protein